MSKKVMPFLFLIRIIADKGICIINQNEAGFKWITSTSLNIVNVSFNSKAPPSNESMYLCLIKILLTVL